MGYLLRYPQIIQVIRQISYWKPWWLGVPPKKGNHHLPLYWFQWTSDRCKNHVLPKTLRRHSVQLRFVSNWGIPQEWPYSYWWKWWKTINLEANHHDLQHHYFQISDFCSDLGLTIFLVIQHPTPHPIRPGNGNAGVVHLKHRRNGRWRTTILPGASQTPTCQHCGKARTGTPKCVPWFTLRYSKMATLKTGWWFQPLWKNIS